MGRRIKDWEDFGCSFKSRTHYTIGENVYLILDLGTGDADNWMWFRLSRTRFRESNQV